MGNIIKENKKDNKIRKYTNTDNIFKNNIIESIGNKISERELKQNQNNIQRKNYQFYIYKHKNNFITVTKFNFITFIPKIFLLQFTRL